MASYIARALIEDATWESIQARSYDGTRYPCGCHPDPKEPHRRFYLCDYHDGFDAGVDRGCHDLSSEVERLRAENAEQAQGWRAERALADQLADALGNEWPGISNKPYSDVSTAHAATTAALSAWKEARRG